MRSRSRVVHSLPLGVLERTSGVVTRDARAVALTAQEIECLRWCKEGKTNWEIGEILGISQKTVEFHVGNTMKKLGAGNRITAVIMGIRNGLISL
jgi:DNA-binding CsgD family transcriptional regulator